MELIDSHDKAFAVARSLATETTLALDTETTGLEWRDTPFMATISTATKDYVIPSRFLSALALAWQAPLITWRFKNPNFDLNMLRKVGIELAGRCEDLTMYARVERNDLFGKGQYSLDSIAKRNGRVKLDIVEKYIKEHGLFEERTTVLGEKYKAKRFDRVPADVMNQYAANDSRITYDLIEDIIPKLDEKQLGIIDIESRLIPMCHFMEYHGARVDIQYTEDARASEKHNLINDELKFRELTGVPFVDSAKTLEPVFTKHGLHIHRTAKGNASFTDDVLESYNSEIASTVRSIRTRSKIISTYYDNILNMADRTTNHYAVIHPSMWQAGTRTRRFSYSEPNLQNLPKDEKSTETYVVRGCFVPRPDRIFVSLDYSQQEYRLMLAYANEAQLIKKVMAGADVHQATADLVGVSRSYAKTLNFAILYGAGPDKIAAMLGITPKEAAKLKLEYFGALPRVEKFIDSVIRVGRARGYVTNWAGYRLYADREFAYALPNHLIQSGGADIIKRAMVKLWEDGYVTDYRLPVMQIHDQLVFDTENDNGFDKIIKVMEDIFPEKNGMKMKVDYSWSDKSFATRDLKGK